MLRNRYTLSHEIRISSRPFDVLPGDVREPWKDSSLWQIVEQQIYATATLFGFKEIRTPLFERTELFARSVGETSDIVTKEMYSFTDRGDRSLTLRPEGTASVMRSFIENNLHQQTSISKFFYIGPMFRYERQQAGRYRQHHQFGAEAIGNDSPEQDVEIIALLMTLYQRLGLTNLQLVINSLGDISAREEYKKGLKAFLEPHYNALSPESQNRFHSNPLRILDTKNPSDQDLLQQAPSILDYLSSPCQKHFSQVQERLRQMGIPFQVNPSLVRGLDYYNNTVFEVIACELGAQNSIGGGGRYDGLLRSLGGPDLPAIGFGTGIERLIQTLIKQNISLPPKKETVLFLIPLGEEAKTVCFSLLQELRSHGIPAQMDFSGRKLGKVMSHADHIGAQFVAVVGEDEIASGKICLKEMKTGEKTLYPMEDLIKVLHWEVRGDNLLSYFVEISKPFSSQSEMDYFAKKIHASIDATQSIQKDCIRALEMMQEVLQEEENADNSTNT